LRELRVIRDQLRLAGLSNQEIRFLNKLLRYGTDEQISPQPLFYYHIEEEERLKEIGSDNIATEIRNENPYIQLIDVGSNFIDAGRDLDNYRRDYATRILDTRKKVTT
jgi:hypothetical protein